MLSFLWNEIFNMPDYYILSYDDSRDDFESIEQYDVGDFDVTAFWTGERFDGQIPNNVRLNLGQGESVDYVPNPLSWPIISDRLWACIEPIAANTCQLVRAPLFREGNRRVNGYQIMNVLYTIAAAKRDTDGEILLTDLRLELDSIPVGAHLFRLAESKTVLIVSSTFLNHVSRRGLKGLAFLPTAHGARN